MTKELAGSELQQMECLTVQSQSCRRGKLSSRNDEASPEKLDQLRWASTLCVGAKLSDNGANRSVTLPLD